MARFTAPPRNLNSVLSCRIAYTQSGGFCIPNSASHEHTAQLILNGLDHEEETVNFIKSHCNQGDIIHAGALFGDFLPALSRGCAPRAKIWAFEPNPENFRCAKITCEINDLQNIDLRNVGLGARNEVKMMLTRDLSGYSHGGVSRMVDAAVNSKSECLEHVFFNNDPEGLDGTLEAVTIVSLDEIVPPDRNISIIHLDIEGFERYALSGALKTIKRDRPIIIIETMPEERWLNEHIISLGYRIHGKVMNNYILIPH